MNLFIEPLDAFLETAYAGAAAQGIDLDTFQLDHLCWRCPTAESYLSAFRAADEGGFIHLETSPVSGRPVSIFCFPDEVYRRKQRPVQLLEITAPKPEQTFKEGYEHLAFVYQDSLRHFVAQYGNLDWDTARIDCDRNPFVATTLGDLTLEFHMLDLQTVLQNAVC